MHVRQLALSPMCLAVIGAFTLHIAFATCTLAQGRPQQDSAATEPVSQAQQLRDRFGFDPRLRHPLVILTRLDSAGNEDGILDPEEVPPEMADFVSDLVKESGFSADRSISLYKVAVERQLHPPAEKPLRSFVIGKDKQPIRDAEQTANYAESFLGIYDRDESGALTSDEWRRIGDGWSSADTDEDGQITAEELNTRFAATIAAADEDSEPAIPVDSASAKSHDGEPQAGNVHARRDAVRTVETADIELIAPLPDWFREKDLNQDGQVMMHEYSDNWNRELVAEFVEYDLNRDGIITPREWIKWSQPKRELAEAQSDR
mgnify:CR=1 FL=1